MILHFYDLGGLEPSIVVFSHHPEDHDRGLVFKNAVKEFLGIMKAEEKDLNIIEAGGAHYDFFFTKPGAADPEIISLSPSDFIKP